MSDSLQKGFAQPHRMHPTRRKCFSHGRDGQQADSENMHVEEATRFHNPQSKVQKISQEFSGVSKE